ncbi:repetitive proline-rich cell wall protein 1-like [Thrips palmi]|uniref:Repetitive proline-rich cell wall protein 1-like n=1 Tax=Thrips palmi TaxID=161013 RepID=A0A6P8ZCV8_THRPL|nr:repetitive proline-rich cell wall protein 1-like [Thrips palmi]
MLAVTLTASEKVLLLTALAEALAEPRVWEPLQPVSVARAYPAPPGPPAGLARDFDDYDGPLVRDRGGLREPVIRDPGFRDPVIRDPGFRDPGFRDPGFRDPGFRDPVLRDPVLRDPGFRDPVLRDSVVRDAVDRVLVTSRDGRATLFERVIPDDVHAERQVMYERMQPVQPMLPVQPRMLLERAVAPPGPPGYDRGDWGAYLPAGEPALDRGDHLYHPGDYVFVPVPAVPRGRAYRES